MSRVNFVVSLRCHIVVLFTVAVPTVRTQNIVKQSRPANPTLSFRISQPPPPSNLDAVDLTTEWMARPLRRRGVSCHRRPSGLEVFSRGSSAQAGKTERHILDEFGISQLPKHPK